jgi:hypothetical protein
MKNRSKILTALAFLVSIADAFSSELSGLINPTAGFMGIKLSRHTVYIRKDVSDASGTFNIIDENTLKVDGVSSISKTSLPKNQAVVFDKIALGYALGTNAGGDEGKLQYDNTNVPAEIRNAVLVITQNGREVLELPVADMVKGQTTATAGDYYHDLESFNYLVDDEQMEWQLKFPKGVSVAKGGAGTDLHKYVELRLQGYKTTRRS